MEEGSSSCQAEKKQEIYLAKIGHFTHKGTVYILPHVLYIQQTLDTPGISSLYDMGETKRNKISFLHRLRKKLYIYWASS